MTHVRRDLLITGGALAFLCCTSEGSAAQTALPPPDAPRSDLEGRPDPGQDPRSTGAIGQSGQSLSDKLDISGGVIRPPADIAPEMTVRPPRPNPGTTRVIPPPGSPGGDPNVHPK